MEPDRIKALRSSMGKTQAGLAAELGLTSTTISQWESGRAAPTQAHLSKLLELGRKGDGPRVAVPAFRPIQYLGSKQRLCPVIADAVSSLVAPGSEVGDLFSGSGVVASALSRRFKTTAVDIQAFSEVLASSLLNGAESDLDALRGDDFRRDFERAQTTLRKIFSELIEVEDDALRLAVSGKGEALSQLIEHGSVAAFERLAQDDGPATIKRAHTAVVDRLRRAQLPKGFATASRYFGAVYFSLRQAIDLDALSAATAELPPGPRRVGKAVLLSVASEIVNTVGKQFAQPVRLVKADGRVQGLLLKRACRDRGLNVFEVWTEWSERWAQELSASRHKGRSVRGDVLKFIEQDQQCSVYYADPPYTIDHYSRFYHVAETLTLRDDPSLDVATRSGREVVMRGLYRANRHQSAFSIPRTAGSAFDALFRGCAKRGCGLIMSYSPFSSAAGHRPRLLELPDLRKLASKYYRSVELAAPQSHAHRKLNAAEVNISAPIDAEALLVCEA